MPLGFQFGFLTETLWQSSETRSPPVSASGLLSGSALVLLTLSPEAMIPSGPNSESQRTEGLTQSGHKVDVQQTAAEWKNEKQDENTG